MKTTKQKEFAKLTNEEMKFIENYRKLSEEKKREVLETINDEIKNARYDSVSFDN